MGLLYHSGRRTRDGNGIVGLCLVGGSQPLHVVPVSVNGHGPLEFVVDSGASLTLLEPETSVRLGLPETGIREGAGAGGRVTITTGVVRVLECAGHAIEDLAIGVTDELKRISRAVNHRLHGVLGFDFLGKYRVGIDYERLRFSLDGPAGAHPQETVPFRLAAPQKPLILTDVSINGQQFFQFAIDTGASTTVISREAAHRLGLHDGASIPPVTGAGGLISASVIRLDELKLGAASARNLEAVAVDFLPALSRAVGEQIDGILGYNYFRLMNFIEIDYPNSRIRLGNADR